MNGELLKRIADAPGVPGFEDAVQAIMTEGFSECCDSVQRDHLGNVIAIKKATLPIDGEPLKLMLAAHADEPGLLVTNIKGNGAIQFRMMGGVASEVVQSQRVIIHSDAPVRGVVCAKGGADGKTAPLTSLLIETGMPVEEVKEKVRLGSPITIDEGTSILNGKMWVGRNFDNRIGSYCLLEAMKKVKTCGVDVYAVSSVQEEVGLRGARASAGGIQPDMGLAIDHPLCTSPYSGGDTGLCEMGKGAGIYIVDKHTIGHPKLVKYLFEMCEKRGISHQPNIGGGTDAKAIQQSPGGAIVTTVGAPVDGGHTSVSRCHADDMDALIDLLVAFMETAHEFYASLDYV